MIVGGLDVGRKNDRTALVLMVDASVVGIVVSPPHSTLPVQAELLRSYVPQTDLTLMDATGLGVGLHDIMAGDRMRPVTISARVAPMEGPDGTVRVGKLWLMGRLHRAIRDREIAISNFCPGRDQLRAELEAMVVKHMPSGGIKVEARQGHDDLVLALSLALLARDMLAGGNLYGQQQAA